MVSSKKPPCEQCCVTYFFIAPRLAWYPAAWGSPFYALVNKLLTWTDLLSFSFMFNHTHCSNYSTCMSTMRVTTLLIKQSSNRSTRQPSTLVAGFLSGKLVLDYSDSITHQFTAWRRVVELQPAWPIKIKNCTLF